MSFELKIDVSQRKCFVDCVEPMFEDVRGIYIYIKLYKLYVGSLFKSRVSEPQLQIGWRLTDIPQIKNSY